MLQFGLSSKTIADIQEIFAKHDSIETAVIYGSRAKGTFKIGSDIDLTLRGNLQLTELLKIENELDDLLLPYKIDLSIENQIANMDLLEHINRVGQLFYTKK